jgi:four helix bundle protein
VTEDEMKARTKQFALRAIRLVDALPQSRSGDVVGRQLLRAATSVGANYRAACRAKSRRDMYSKLGTVEEEADESAFWLELIAEAELMSATKTSALRQEAEELVCIVVASRRTLQRNLRGDQIKNQNSKIENR